MMLVGSGLKPLSITRSVVSLVSSTQRSSRFKEKSMFEIRPDHGAVDTTLRVAVLDEEHKKPRDKSLSFDIKDSDPLILRPGEDARLISTIKVVVFGQDKIRFEVIMATRDGIATPQTYEGGNHQRAFLLLQAFRAAVVHNDDDREAITRHVEDFLNLHLGAPGALSVHSTVN